MRILVLLVMAACTPGGVGDSDTAPSPLDTSETGGDTSDTGPSYDCLAASLETRLGADGAPLVQGMVDGATLWFAVDTAAQVIYLDDEYTGGSTEYVNADVVVGPYDLPQWMVKGRDLALNEETLGLDTGALLGQEILVGATVFIDPTAPTAWLCEGEPTGVPPGFTGESTTLAVEMQNQFAVANVGMGGAGDVPLMVDAGLPVTYVTEDVFDLVDSGAPRFGGWVFATKYGSDEAFLSTMPALSLGAGVGGLSDVPVLVIPTDHHLADILYGSGVDCKGFLGNDVLDRFAYALRGPGGAIEVWAPQGAPPLASWWTRVGVDLVWRGGAFVVNGVLTPSDAADQGIVVGDEVAAIDGVVPADLSAALAGLSGAPGETRRLSLAGVGGVREVGVDVEEFAVARPAEP